MISRREEQDLLDRTILEFLMKGNKICWTDLEKRTLATCHPWATGGRFKSRLYYLVKQKHVRRIVRGIYKITEKGRKYYDALL